MVIVDQLAAVVYVGASSNRSFLSLVGSGSVDAGGCGLHRASLCMAVVV